MIEKLIRLQKSAIVKQFANFVFPPHCLLCQRAGKWICDSCDQNNNTFTQICFACKEGSFQGKTHRSCESKTSIDRLIAFYNYNKVTKELLKEFKFKHGYVLLDTIIELIEKRIKPYRFEPTTFITAIPLHPNRERWRGFNQSELVAKRIAKIINIRYINLLKRTKDTRPQSSLKYKLRKVNMENAFIVDNNYQIPEKSSIIIFDDVITSGATIENASSTIKNTNPNTKIIAMCFALSVSNRKREISTSKDTP